MTSISHTIGVSFSFFVIVSLFKEISFLEIFSKIFALSNQNVIVVAFLILLVLGFYTPLISTAKELMSNIVKGIFTNFWQYLGLLGCFAIGIIVGFITVAKFMSFLLKKYHDITFYGIIGFIIGSTIALFCNYEIVDYYKIWASGSYVFMPMWLEILLGIILLIGGFFITYFIGKYASKKEDKIIENKD